MKFGEVIKIFQSKKGNSITLRCPKEDDLNGALGFANELIAEDTYILLSGNTLTKEEEQTYLYDLLGRIRKNEASAVYAFCDGKMIGSATVEREKFRNSHMGVPGIVVLQQFRHEGIGYMMFKEIIEESKKMGLRLLDLHCFEGNDRAIRMYEQFGFKRVGIIPDAVLYKGKYIGEVIMYLPLM